MIFRDIEIRGGRGFIGSLGSRAVEVGFDSFVGFGVSILYDDGIRWGFWSIVYFIVRGFDIVRVFDWI